MKILSTTVYLAIAMVSLVWHGDALAQADEIQVYDASLAQTGVFNLTWHNNYTPDGIEEPAFPGAIISDQSLNGVTEWAYGVNEWFEAGLYLPLYSIDKDQGVVSDGMKLRALFAVPHAESRTFFYGVGFELGFNARRWDQTGVTSEIRPIIGWHLGNWDLISNPILDTAYDGLKNMEFAPSTRVAYNFNDQWAVAVEEYANFGPLKGFYGSREQTHQLFAVVDFAGMPVEVEAGVGFGLTGASDDLTFKLILSMDLNK